MIQVARHITVARSAADCYRYLADFSTREQWDPAAYRATKRTPGAPRVGSEFRVVISVAGRRRVLRYRISALDPGRRIVLRGRAAGLATEETIECSAEGDDACRITYHGEFSLRGPLARMRLLAGPVIRRLVARAMTGLRDALTPPTTPPRQGWLSYAADRSLVAGGALFTDRGYFAMRRRSHTEFMDGRVVAITGATSGIGRAIAAEYARLGAHLVLIGRDHQRLADAAQFVRDFAGADADAVAIIEADLLDSSQVQRAGAELLARHEQLDVLVNNAGAVFAEYDESADGIERTTAVNLVAPFVLTESVMPALQAARGRVVNMSSGGMYITGLDIDGLAGSRDTHDGLKAYAKTKRALVALNCHWARRYGDAGISFNAMHPGWVATPGVAEALPRFNAVLRPLLRDARMGADTAVWLGCAASVASANGVFFLDRTPRSTTLIWGTGFKPSEAQSLYSWLRNTVDIEIHGLR